MTSSTADREKPGTLWVHQYANNTPLGTYRYRETYELICPGGSLLQGYWFVRLRLSEQNTDGEWVERVGPVPAVMHLSEMEPMDPLAEMAFKHEKGFEAW